jgi:hypothetical protein
MEQSLSVANNSSASQEIVYNLLNLKIHYRVYNSLPLPYKTTHKTIGYDI